MLDITYKLKDQNPCLYGAEPHTFILKRRARCPF